MMVNTGAAGAALLSVRCVARQSIASASAWQPYLPLHDPGRVRRVVRARDGLRDHSGAIMVAGLQRRLPIVSNNYASLRAMVHASAKGSRKGHRRGGIISSALSRAE